MAKLAFDSTQLVVVVTSGCRSYFGKKFPTLIRLLICLLALFGTGAYLFRNTLNVEVKENRVMFTLHAALCLAWVSRYNTSTLI